MNIIFLIDYTTMSTSERGEQMSISRCYRQILWTHKKVYLGLLSHVCPKLQTLGCTDRVSELGFFDPLTIARDNTWSY